jgi:hypothetical protein
MHASGFHKEQLDKDEQVQFKGNAKAFNRTYNFLASVMHRRSFVSPTRQSVLRWPSCKEWFHRGKCELNFRPRLGMLQPQSSLRRCSCYLRLLLTTAFALHTVARARSGESPPTSFAELNAWYVEPPLGQNAALTFLSALNAIQISSNDWRSYALPWIGRGDQPGLDQPVRPENMRAAAQFLSRNEVAVRRLRYGTALTKSRYPLDFSTGIETMLPHLAKIATAARVMNISALYSASKGRAAEAADDVVAGFALARSLNEEPLVISQVVRCRTAKLTIEGFEQVVNRTFVSSANLQRIENIVEDLARWDTAGTGFSRGLTGDRLGTLSLFTLPLEKQQSLLSQLLENLPPSERITNQPAGYARDIDEKFTDSLYVRLLDSWRAPYPQRLSLVLTACSNELKTAKEKMLTLGIIECHRTLDAVLAEARTVAGFRIVETAAALDRFRAAIHRYPRELREMVPRFMGDVPGNPYTGEALTYETVAAGYKLAAAPSDLQPASLKIEFRVVVPPASQRDAK